MNPWRRRAALVFVAGLVLLAAWSWPIAPTVAASTPTSAWYVDGPDGRIIDDAGTWNSYPAPDGQHWASVQAMETSSCCNVAEAIYLDGPDETPLAPGTYTDAVYPRQAGHPFLFFQMAPADCVYAQTGTFTVHEVAYAGDGSLSMLALDYLIECARGFGAQGAVRFNSAWPVRAIAQLGNNLDFGDVVTGDSAQKTVTIRSVGTAAATINGFEVKGPSADRWTIVNDTCSGNSIAPGDSCTVDMSITPVVSGPFEDRLWVMSDAVTPNEMSTILAGRALTRTTITVGPSGTVIEGQPFTVQAVLTPTPPSGNVRIYLDGNVIAAPPLNNPMFITAPGVSHGPHTLQAQYDGYLEFASSDSGVQTFYVGQPTATTITTTKSTTYVDQLPTITAKVSGPTGLTGGTLVVRDDVTSSVLGQINVTATTRSLTIKPSLIVGAHLLIAEYSGTNDYSVSAASTGVTILADTGVALSKVTVSPTTFYPYKDSYRDTTSIGGTLNEPATASVSIYSPSGSRVKLVSLGTKNGTYSYKWNGRNSAGTMLASGKYKIVQKFKDGTGHTLSKTSYVTLSHKRLYTYTTYLNKAASQYVKRSTSMIAWQFTLPSATIYKSLTFSVYGVTGVPPAQFGAWDTRLCSFSHAWDHDCMRPTSALPFQLGWASVSPSATYGHSGRYLRGMAWANYLASGSVSKVRVKVVYGILK